MATAEEKEVTVTIGNYDVTFYPELGSGTFGKVYKARHKRTQRLYAAKQIRIGERGQLNEYMYNMAERELTLIMRLRAHRNVIKLKKRVLDKDSYFIFMEYCDLGNLKTYLQENKNLSFEEKIKIMYQTASAIAFMHSQNPSIIHRDIKLENILMRTEHGKDVVKLVDFGLAKVFEDKFATSLSEVYRQGKYMTTACGSQFFQAPEFFAELEGGLKYDETVDVFALGLVFAVVLQYGPDTFEILPISVQAKREGKVVKFGTEMLVRTRRKEPLPSIVERNVKDDLNTERVKRIIVRMTKYRANDRKNMQEVEEELNELLRQIEEKMDMQRLREASEREIRDLSSRLERLRLQNEQQNRRFGEEREATATRMRDIEQENEQLRLQIEEFGEKRTRMRDIEQENKQLRLQIEEFGEKRTRMRDIEQENEQLRLQIEEFGEERTRMRDIEQENEQLRLQIEEFGEERTRMRDIEQENEQLRLQIEEFGEERTRMRDIEQENQQLRLQIEELCQQQDATAQQATSYILCCLAKWKRPAAANSQTLNKKPTGGASQMISPVDLATIKHRSLTKHKETGLRSPPWSVRMIRGELWCCCSDGISIYNTSLDLQRHVAQDKGGIFAATDIGDAVVVAAEKGLFVLTHTGEDVKKISDSAFTGVTYHDGKIYGAHVVSASTQVYNTRTWKRTNIIDSPCSDGGHTHTVQTNGEYIVMACRDTDCIYSMTMTGQVITKHGQEGSGTGQFNSPRICQLDSNGTMLVADCGNDRLQLCESGEWTVPQLDCPPRPRGALYRPGALYVVSGSHYAKKKITKYVAK